nr:GDSL esterase/lipase At5g33370-like [Tanacetum cinerariifolium]
MAILWLVLGLCLTAEVFAMPDKTTLWLGPHVAPKGAHSTPKESSPSREAPSPSPKGHGTSPRPKVHSPSSSYSPNAKQVRAFFVFGDSLVDNGNNNYLYTIARADMLPYGIDTPDHLPTGRFSNGLNIPDIISEHIGSEPTLPYLSPELDGQKLLVGANFASAGVGILNDTGLQFVNVLTMPLQLEYFREYQQRLSRVIGEKQAKELVNQALVLVSLGGNDFVNNYYLFPFSPRSQQSELPEFVAYLLA